MEIGSDLAFTIIRFIEYLFDLHEREVSALRCLSSNLPDIAGAHPFDVLEIHLHPNLLEPRPTIGRHHRSQFRRSL